MKYKFKVGDWVLFTVSVEQDFGKIISFPYKNSLYLVRFHDGTKNWFSLEYFKMNNVRKISENEAMIRMLEL